MIANRRHGGLVSCVLGCAFLVGLILPAPGQTPAATPQPGATSKRDTCKTTVVAQRLKGAERYGAMLICLAEGRLDCTKQAVAKKLPRDELKLFIKACVGTKPESKKDEKRDAKPDGKQDDQND